MFLFGKKKKETAPKEPKERMVRAATAEDIDTIAKANEQIVSAIAAINGLVHSVEVNQDAVARLSESISILSQYYQSLDSRMRAVEDLFTVNIVNFNKPPDMS